MKWANSHRLNLRVGEIVEVRSKEEILSTLDCNGKIDGLPFMPEMFRFCGLRFRVYKRADRTCDTITHGGMRRMHDAVHLEGLRCDGSFHGGCQAACFLFWKEPWLKRASRRGGESDPVRKIGLCTETKLLQATHAARCSSEAGEIFSCQATELPRATTRLTAWDIRPYLRDIWSGNLSVKEAVIAVFWRAFRTSRTVGAYRLQIWLYNKIQQVRRRELFPYPYPWGELRKTPCLQLNLQPGNVVKVRSYKEITSTLDTAFRNRGLSFDVEMTKYCDGTYKVLQRVERVINEQTGEMMKLPRDCLILEQVTCKGDYHWGCPRSLYPFWREIWLERVDQ